MRWIAYLLPLTYFTEISRGVMLRAEPIGSLWPPFVFLALLAGGRVVAAGTAAQIVGSARTAVVRAADWAAALRRLEAAGLRAVLSGTALRVAGRPAAEVAAVLADLPASVTTEPATLEECFFELVADG